MSMLKIGIYFTLLVAYLILALTNNPLKLGEIDPEQEEWNFTILIHFTLCALGSIYA
jgi:hypothetical protein